MKVLWQTLSRNLPAISYWIIGSAIVCYGLVEPLGGESSERRMGLGILLAAMTYPMGWIGGAIWAQLTGMFSSVGLGQGLKECIGAFLMLAFGFVQWFVFVPIIVRSFTREKPLRKV